MRVLVTGLRGTVGQALAARLADHEVVGWDRTRVPIDRYDAMDRFVADVAPDVLVNLAIASQPTGRENEQWLVNYDWPSELAWICRTREIRFVHASTVMVFAKAGPFTIESVPDATEGYGGQKRAIEERVRHQHPRATIVRLGWQIGAGSNTMNTYLANTPVASKQFFPACSFLPDTAAAIVSLFDSPGLYMIDSNERWSFYDIARALGFDVAENDLVRDERMFDARLAVPSLRQRLHGLVAPTS